jgi:hypothetical protein
MSGIGIAVAHEFYQTLSSQTLKLANVVVLETHKYEQYSTKQIWRVDEFAGTCGGLEWRWMDGEPQRRT